MKLLPTIFSFLFAISAFGQNPDCLPNQYHAPWVTTVPDYYAYDWVTVGGLQIKTPVPGVQINAAYYSDIASGWHSHELMANLRPLGSFVNGTTALMTTGPDGHARWNWKHGGFSAQSLFNFIPTNSSFPSICTNVYLREGAHAYGSNTFLSLVPFRATGFTMDFSLHEDTRHRDTVGLHQYSRHGTGGSVGSMQALVYSYAYLNTFNPQHLYLDVWRGTTPDGGIADNQVINGVLLPDWVNQSGEKHRFGTEWDVSNPLIQAGNDELHWIGFLYVLHTSECQLGRADHNGNLISPTNDHNAINAYWHGQDIVHLACAGDWVQ